MDYDDNTLRSLLGQNVVMYFHGIKALDHMVEGDLLMHFGRYYVAGPQRGERSDGCVMWRVTPTDVVVPVDRR